MEICLQFTRVSDVAMGDHRTRFSRNVSPCLPHIAADHELNIQRWVAVKAAVGQGIVTSNGCLLYFGEEVQSCGRKS
jgi:hypothetical protein